MSNNVEQPNKLRWFVILFPVSIFSLILIMGFVNADLFVSVLWGYFEWLMVNFGWLVSLGALSFVIFAVVCIFHKTGNIRLGGEDAKAEFSVWNWWAMSLCAGMAMGIVMWPAPEALSHSLYPAQGMNLEPGSHEAIIWAMRTTFLHWTFTPYAIYVVCGALIGYAHFNLKKPFRVSSALYPLIGDRAFGPIGTFVDALTIFAITGGVAGSLGMGMLQLGSGLDFVFGIEPGPVIWASIAIAIVVAYTTSSITGLHRGIKWLSDKNAWLFIALLIFAFIFGPKAFTLNLMTQSVGAYFGNFVQAMTFTDPFPGGDLWPQWWDMFWFTDWLSFAPIVGMFLVRISYGRTIRQFFVVNMIMPATFGLLWFGVFGALTIHTHFIAGIDLDIIMQQRGMEVLMLQLFDVLPLADIIRPIMIMVIFISFVTLADSMTSTVAGLSLSSTNPLTTEPPIGLKVFWGSLMGLTAIIFVFNGGLDGIKVVKTMAGLPIVFIEILMVTGFVIHRFRLNNTEKTTQDKISSGTNELKL